MNELYAILNPGKSQYWNLYDGWTTLENADLYTMKDRQQYNIQMPTGGEWYLLPTSMYPAPRQNPTWLKIEEMI